MAGNFDIVAAFRDPSSAERVAKDLERRGVSRRHLHLVRSKQPDRARVAEMRGEMQEEVDESVAGPGVVLSPEQAKGAGGGVLIGAIVGLAAGLAVGALWAFGFESAMSQSGRLFVAGLCFLAAGATIGFVLGGALKPRLDAAEHPGKMLDERELAGEADTLLEVHIENSDDAHMIEEVLERAGAERVDAVDREGTPLPPQSEHPRPADPPGYWQGNGRKRG
jgi:hypothetical protein